MKFAFAAALASLVLTAAVPAVASEGVPRPLSRQLLNETWTVIELNGKRGESDPATITFDGELASGQTQCQVGWTAQYTISLPKVSLFDVQAPAYSCDAAKQTTEFLMTLEQVARVRNGRDGLEFYDAKGKRVMLLTAGG